MKRVFSKNESELRKRTTKLNFWKMEMNFRKTETSFWKRKLAFAIERTNLWKPAGAGTGFLGNMRGPTRNMTVHAVLRGTLSEIEAGHWGSYRA